MKSIWVKRVLFVALGAGGGFAYYYFIGCASGTCPISSSPYISTVYGALIGGMAGWPRSDKNSKEASS